MPTPRRARISSALAATATPSPRSPSPNLPTSRPSPQLLPSAASACTAARWRPSACACRDPRDGTSSACSASGPVERVVGIRRRISAPARDDLTDEETEDLLLDLPQGYDGEHASIVQSGGGRGGEEEERREGLRELGARGRQGARESPSAFCFEERLRRRRVSPRARATQANLRLSTRLAVDDANAVGTVEHVLSALEACGVDNARIEGERRGFPSWTAGVSFTHARRPGRVVPAPSVDAGDDSASG